MYYLRHITSFTTENISFCCMKDYNRKAKTIESLTIITVFLLACTIMNSGLSYAIICHYYYVICKEYSTLMYINILKFEWASLLSAFALVQHNTQSFLDIR